MTTVGRQMTSRPGRDDRPPAVGPAQGRDWQRAGAAAEAVVWQNCGNAVRDNHPV